MSTTLRSERTWGRRARRTMGAIGFLAAASVALAPAASAAPGQTSADGLTCTGFVTCGPAAHSEYPAGPASNSVANASVAGPVTNVASTGLINTTATAGGATASVANLSASLAPTTSLTADAVSSSCTVDPNTGAVSGSSSITNGALSIAGTSTALSAAPAPNTGINVTGVGTVTLNRQTTAPDGTLTVDAVYISLLNGTQTIAVATSTCGVPTAAVPAIAPAFAATGGALAAVALPFAVVWYRRRQTA